jgi:Uma2 family endonuclease
MPTRDSTITTIEAVLALPDDGLRHELLDGVHTVTPAPQYPHQAVLSEWMRALLTVLAGRDTLQVLTSPADIVLGPRTLVQPDLFVIRRPAGRRLKQWSEVGVPLVAIEFLSPGTAARDRGAKRRIYQRSGIAEYWIVDLDARLVERWQPLDERPEMITDTLRWQPDAALPPLMLELPPLFERALGPG